MKRLLTAIALFAIIFLSSCAPAGVGVGVRVGPRPYYGRPYYGRPYYRPYPYYRPNYGYGGHNWGRSYYRGHHW